MAKKPTRATRQAKPVKYALLNGALVPRTEVLKHEQKQAALQAPDTPTEETPTPKKTSGKKKAKKVTKTPKAKTGDNADQGGDAGDGDGDQGGKADDL